ncbi:MAG: hypothetical protein KU28_00105 [Sulfurovum sp. PC08-66]|nr:MAG: hypothetical protein KU28_00105 [Sulfurovum sp. PC08-66]KIM12377.1 MAG: hypothetical protein KU37_00225 [Sulfuricurvum sp. PC08-66]
MRLFLLWGIALTVSLALEGKFFTSIDKVELAKDQRLYITVTDRLEEKLLAFRWTLFHNEGLVTITHWDGNPMQHLLYKRYDADSIKVNIALRKEEESLFHPYILITFLGYDYATKKATLRIAFHDKQQQTQIQITKE